MKKQKNLVILFLSLLAMGIIIGLSYVTESRSEQLPALVTSDKVFISSEVDGVLSRYFVTSMQDVAVNAPIAEISNSKLPFKLATLRNEKQKYDELITSARTGDYLKTELYSLDEDIQKNRMDLDDALLEIEKINHKIPVLQERYASGVKKYNADKTLYDKGILSNADFEKASRDFWDVHDQYYELKGDSLVAAKTITSSQTIISLLEARKKILSGNVDMLAAKYLIDLNDVDANINDLQEEINNLKVYAPVAGIVTDINYRPGEKIDKGDVIAQIADLSNVWITAYGTSTSRQRARVGQKVCIYALSGKKVWGKVMTVSPVMEKVKSLASTYETTNTYTKIEIRFDHMKEALNYITPGERLFVRLFF